MDNSTNLYYLDLYGTTIGYISMTFLIIIIFPIVIGNIFVLVAYKNTPRLNAPINLLLVNLALTDLLSGLCSIPWSILVFYLKLGVDRDKYACLLGLVSMHIPLGVSCITMLCIGIVRSISVYNPFKSRFWITHKRIVVLMVLTWIYMIILVCGTMYLSQDWAPNKPCRLAIVTGIAYSAVMGAHIIVVGVGSTAFYILFIISIKKVTDTISPNANVARADKEYENRKTKMVISIVFCYYACWTPALLYILIRNLILGDSSEIAHWENIIKHFTIFILFCNSFMNPFIYAGYNPTFRSVCQRYINTMICVKRKTSNNYRIEPLPKTVNTTLNIESFSNDTYLSKRSELFL